MSRLYYEGPGLETPMGTQESSAGKAYLEKVAKLVPSEIIAGYLAMIGFVPSIKLIPETNFGTVYLILFLVCLALTAWYIKYQAEQGRPYMKHLIVSVIAFVIWAYTTSGHLVFPDFHDTAIASIVLVIFSLVSGKIPLD